MSFWLTITPLISAVLGWFLTSLLIKMLFRPIRPQRWLGFSVQGFIPKHQLQLSARIGNLLSRELISFNQIEEKILDESTLQKIIPEIETHIDHFLRVKLKDAMPMVAMFVGDKTIVQLKEVFMTEMKILFPEIMRSYIDKLKDDFNIGERVAHKLAILPSGKIELFFFKTLHRELRYVRLAGMVLGFIIGFFQLIIILLILS